MPSSPLHPRNDHAKWAINESLKNARKDHSGTHYSLETQRALGKHFIINSRATSFTRNSRHKQYALRTWILRPIFLGGILLLLCSKTSSLAVGKQDLAELLELRSYTRIGGTLEFSVHNKEKGRGEWLRVNDERHGYKIKSYDPDTNTIVIRYNNRIGTLHLQGSRITDYVPEPAASGGGSDRGQPVSSRQNPNSVARTTPPRPVNTPPERTRETSSSPSRGQDSSNRSGTGVPFMNQQRGPSSPDSPSAPSSPSEKPPEQGETPDDSYWANMDSPPPLPPTLPPGYSPEE